ELVYEGYIFMNTTDVHSEGSYRCEVSTEAPFFRTVKGESEMRIYGNVTESGKKMKEREYYICSQWAATKSCGPIRNIVTP
ncbi:hypothetical protein CEXT_609371, partial [Caerostris extrusa]